MKYTKCDTVHTSINILHTGFFLSFFLIFLYRLFTFSGRTCLRGVQGNPNKFPILVQGDAVHGIGTN